jgi:Putative peptidoglycan binding domain/Glycosyl hydrolase family 46
MSRNLYASGAHGGVVESIQRALSAVGSDTKGVDGSYGRNTTAAVKDFQAKNKLPATGIVDDQTWQVLMMAPIPGTDIRSLELTAAFEGHGYTLIQGNWDGAWLTWGIIGFTLKHGELQKIISEAQSSFPNRIREAFGDNAPALVAIMNDTSRNQEAWADRISNGARVVEPWLSAFRVFGQIPEVQDIQRKHAHADYFVPALNTAKRLGFKSELGLALCFDIHVQNGGIKAEAHADIDDAIAASPPASERQLREIVASAVADNAAARFVADVRSRKLTIARGEGDVHGGHFVLANWGLDDVPTPELL